MTYTIYDVKVLALAAAIPTGVVTIIRLLERVRRRNLGFDDAFAALSLIGLFLFHLAIFLHLGNPAQYSFTTRYALYYLIAQSFYLVIWPARLSIMFMIIRITPPHTGTRRVLYVIAGCFVITWIVLASQVFWVCERIATWKLKPSPQCPLGTPVAIAQLISDILSDAVLVIAPLRLIWHLEVSVTERTRLLLVFSSSIVTTITSLIHAYYILRVGGLDVVFVAIIEVCSSLLVCNVAVIFSLISRLLPRVKKPSFVQRSEDLALDGRSPENSGMFGRGARSLAFKRDTAIHVELETHQDKTIDTTASYLDTKSEPTTSYPVVKV